ncbi:MAG: type I restriction-modification system subunit M N-terminal domain-containing protein [Granulosicoccus sp.]
MARTAKQKPEEPLEKTLWKSADKLRKNMDAAEYKHVVLGLIFLKYISDAFEELHSKLVAGEGEYEGADPEDADERDTQRRVAQSIRSVESGLDQTGNADRYDFGLGGRTTLRYNETRRYIARQCSNKKLTMMARGYGSCSSEQQGRRYPCVKPDTRNLI